MQHLALDESPHPVENVKMCIVQDIRLSLMLLRAIFMAALCFVHPSASALDPAVPLDSYRHERWGEVEGAPRFIDALAQTEDGWMWVSARYAGLFRFDGVRFYPFVSNDGSRLSGAAISVLRPGPDGALWIGHGRGGVSVLRDGRFEHVITPEISGGVYAISHGIDGATWVASKNGLFRIAGKRAARVGATQGLRGPRAEYVLADGAGRVWAVDGAALYLLAPGTRAFQRLRSAGPDAMVIEAPDGSVHLVIEKRFARVAGPGERGAPPRGRGNTFQSTFDAQGNLWSGNCPVGLCVLRPAAWQGVERFTPVGAPERLDQQWQMTSLTVISLLEDRDGSLWIGTPAGLERLRDQAVHMDASRFDRGVAIPALHPDGDIRVVQVRRYDGVSELLRIRGGRVEPQSNPLGVRMLDTAPDGTLVLAGDHGLERHGPAGVERIDLPAPMREAGATVRIRGLAAGNRDIYMWTGHFGLWHYRDGSWSASKEALGSQPLTIALDAAGRSYAGRGGNRLRIEDGAQVREYGPAEGIDVGPFNLIVPGAPLLIAGEKGMQALVGGRFRHLRFMVEGGLGAITGLVRDGAGNVWVNGERGIFRVDAGAWTRALADPEQPVPGNLYDALDGYAGGAATSIFARTALAAPDGTLWFAGERGLASIDPRKAGVNPATPDVAVLSLTARGHAYRPDQRIGLPEGSEDIQIDYTTPSLRAPHRVRFRYRISGGAAGEDWVDAGARRTAYFQRLRPGEHVFEVQAFNESGVPSRVATLRFEIKPRITQTWWFLAACIAAGLLLAIFLYRLRTRQLAARIEDRLLARVHERESIARTLHDTFLQSVQGMLLSLQAATTRLAPDNPVRAEFERLLDSARGVLVEGRDEIQGLRENFASPAAFRDALMRDVETAVPGSLLRIEATGPALLQALQAVPLSRDLYAIVREALLNALQHTEGKVVLRARMEARQVLLSVADAGPGLAGFAEGKPGHFGLLGMRERAAQIGARLRIDSDGGGTTVTLAIPAAYTVALRA